MTTMKKAGIHKAGLGAFAAGAIVAASTIGSGAAEAKTQLLFNIFVPPTHLIKTAIADGWIKRVEAASKGEIAVRVPGSTLAPAPRQWGMVTDGIADVTIMFNAFEPNRLSLIQMSLLPFNAPSARAAGTALWRTHNKHFAPADQYKGVKLLGFFSLAPGQFHSLKKPITTIADIKNVKIRVSPGVPAKLASALDGVPVPTPGIKAYEVVSKGVVDAMFLPIGEVVSLKMAQFIKHTLVVPGGIYGSSFSVFMNQKKFDGLPKALQDVVIDASGEKISADGAAFDRQDTEAIKAMTARGTTFTDASAAFVAEATTRSAFLTEAWLAEAKKAGIDGQAALDFYRSEAKKIAAEK